MATNTMPPLPSPTSSSDCQQQGQQGYSVQWMLKVESLVLFSAFVIVFLSVLSTYARRSKALYYFVTFVSTLSLPIITNTVSTADNAKSDVPPLLLVSAIFLHLIYKKISPSRGKFVFQRNNNLKGLEGENRGLIAQITSLAWIGFLLITSDDSVPKELKVPSCTVLALSMLKLLVGRLSFICTRKSFRNSKRVIGSYMENLLPPESSPPPAIFDMSDFRFLVTGEDKQDLELSPGRLTMYITKPDELVTLDKVWACKAKHLRDNERNRQVSISFALFKILRGELEDCSAALAPASPGRGRAQRLLLNGPFRSLSESQQAQCVFEITETQLAFLNDYLFTAIPFTYYPWTTILDILLLLPLLLCCLFLIVTIICRTVAKSSYLHDYYDCLNSQGSENSYHDVKVLFALDFSVCIILIVIPFVMEAWEIIAYLFSDWVRVALVCKYVVNPRQFWAQRALNVLSRYRRGILKSWSNKVNQHCLLRPIIFSQRYFFVQNRK